MAPEYGATMGFFGIDEATIAYLRGTGRTRGAVRHGRELLQGAGPLGHPATAARSNYTQVVELDLATVEPGVAGPKRPQDRIDVDALKAKWDVAAHRARAGRLRQDTRGSDGEPLDLPDTLDEVPDDPTGVAIAFGAGVGVVTENLPTNPAIPLWEVTVDSKGGVEGHHRPRLRAHRRHHELHQHQQPERHARRRPAREEGQRARASP